MADQQNVVLFSDPAAIGVAAVATGLLITLAHLGRAKGALGQDRKKKIGARIDAFAAASKNGINPVDAYKAHGELLALKATYDGHDQALGLWEDEVKGRLDQLSDEFWNEVAAALDTQIALLKLQEEKEQDEVDEVQTVLSEFEQRRHELQSRAQKRQAAAKKAQKAE
jgi:hypothetical protein